MKAQISPRRPMPTVIACTVAGVILVLMVGFQAPAISTGLRWKPSSGSGPPLFIPNRSGGSPISFGLIEQGGLAWLLVLLVVGASLALLYFLFCWIRDLLRPAPRISIVDVGLDSGVSGDLAIGAFSEPDAQIVQSGLAAAFQILTSERDPGNAVIRAWLSLQDAAAAAGIDRHPAETTSEFTARILRRSRDSADPIHVLLSLYQRVRFGGHVPDEVQIAAVRDSVTVLIGLWQTDLPDRRPAARPR